MVGLERRLGQDRPGQTRRRMGGSDPGPGRSSPAAIIAAAGSSGSRVGGIPSRSVMGRAYVPPRVCRPLTEGERAASMVIALRPAGGRSRRQPAGRHGEVRRACPPSAGSGRPRRRGRPCRPRRPAPRTRVVLLLVADLAVDLQDAVVVLEHPVRDRASEGVLRVGVDVHLHHAVVDGVGDLLRQRARAAVEDQVEGLGPGGQAQLCRGGVLRGRGPPGGA